MTEEKLNPTVKRIVDWVQQWIDYSDSLYCRRIKRDGKENEIEFETDIESSYRNEYGTKSWEEVSKEELNRHYFEKLDYDYCNENNIGNLKHVEIDGEKISVFDFKKINELLNPLGYFEIYNGKESFLIAKLIEHRKENECDIYKLGEELVRDMNYSLHSAAFISFEDKTIIERTESAEDVVWKRIKRVNNNKISVNNEEQKEMYKECIANFVGVSQEELEKTSYEYLEEKVKKAACKVSEISINHEFGHNAAYETGMFPFEKYLKLKEVDENFAISLSEIFAETIKTEDICGSFAYIESIKDEKERGATLGFLLINYLSNSHNEPFIHYMKMLAPEFENLYDDYKKTQDVSIIKETREKVFNRTKELADEICEYLNKGDEGSVKKIIADFERKYEERNKNDKV